MIGYLLIVMAALTLASCAAPQPYRTAVRDAAGCRQAGGVPEPTSGGVRRRRALSEGAPKTSHCKAMTMSDAKIGDVDALLVACADGAKPK